MLFRAQVVSFFHLVTSHGFDLANAVSCPIHAAAATAAASAEGQTNIHARSTHNHWHMNPPRSFQDTMFEQCDDLV